MGLRYEASIPDAPIVIERLKGLGKLTQGILEEVIEEIMEETIAVLAVHAPATAGNDPPPPYYERWKGYHNRTGNIRPDQVSEQLTTSWQFATTTQGLGVSARIGTNVSYAGYVHGGKESALQQTKFHQEHGWKKLEDIIVEKVKADAPPMIELGRRMETEADAHLSRK